LKYPVDTGALLKQLIATGSPISNTTLNPNFPNPYSIQWNLAIQREIGHGIVLDTGYVGNRSLHLNMVRMLNLPDRLTGISPNPAFGQFRYYDGSDNSRYNAWQTSLQKRYSAGLSFTVAYTWASNTSLGDNDLLLNTVPQDNNNLRADHGSTPFDIRNSLTSSFVYELPFARRVWFGGALAHQQQRTGRDQRAASARLRELRRAAQRPEFWIRAGRRLL